MGIGENPRQFIGMLPLYLRVLVLLTSAATYRFWKQLLRSFLMGGKVNGERGAFANFADDVEKSAVAFYNSLNRGEPQAGAFVRFFCSEERLKNFLQDVRFNAVAGIGHSDHDMGTRDGLGLQRGYLVFQDGIV